MGKSRQQIDQESRLARASLLAGKRRRNLFTAANLPERLPRLLERHRDADDEDVCLETESIEASCDICFDLGETSGRTDLEWVFETADGRDPQAALDLLYAHHLRVHPTQDFDADRAIAGMSSAMGGNPPQGSLFVDCPECGREVWVRPGEDAAHRLENHYLKRHPRAAAPKVTVR